MCSSDGAETSGSLVPSGFGVPSEWRHFLASNPNRTKAIQELLGTCAKVFIRTLVSDQPADRLGFYLGRVCVEEFNEILLLAGNGYGFGALKILRGMFERAVTSAYLLAHMDQAERFVNFDYVHKYKAYNHLKNLHGKLPLPPAERIAEIIAQYEAVKADYQDEVCKVCHKFRNQPSWTKLDTASMAAQVGEGYAELYYSAFYRPTLELHTTATSVMSRLKEHRDGSIGFDEGPQHEKADLAIILAHNLLLRVIASQNEHFSLGLDSAIKECVAQFTVAYGRARETSALTEE